MRVVPTSSPARFAQLRDLHARGHCASSMLWFIVAIGQVAADLVLHRRVPPLYQDGAAYHLLATRLAQHGAFGPPVAFRPPGWVFVLAGVYRVTGPHPVAGLALNVILAGFSAVLLFKLGQRLGLPLAASWLLALGAGLFPWMLMLGATLYSEVLYVCILIILALAVVRLWEHPGGGAWRWGLLGALAGGGALVRPALLFWLPVVFVFALRRGGPGRLRTATALCAGAFVVLCPWTVRNYLRLHAFVPIDTAGGSTLAVANNDLARAGQSQAGLPPIPPGTEVQGDSAYRKAALNWIGAHPAGFVALIGQRLLRSLDPTALLNKGVVGSAPTRWLVRGIWAMVLALAAWGIILRHRGPWAWLLTLFVPQAVEITLFGGGFRFFAPCVCLGALWVAV